MTTLYRVHGEIGGRVLAAGGTTAESSAAEGFALLAQPTRLVYPAGGPTDIHGNGGSYSISSNSIHYAVDLQPEFDGLVGGPAPEAMVRLSYYFTGVQGLVWEGRIGSGNIEDLVKLIVNADGSVTLTTRSGMADVVRGTTNALGLNQWVTLWLYYRTSQTLTGTGHTATASADGRVTLWGVSPYLASGTPLLDFTGTIFRAWYSQSPGNTIAAHYFGNVRSYTKLDDIVAHAPSIQFTSANQTLPAVGSALKFTDGSGNVVVGVVAGVKDLGLNASNLAIASIQLTHMVYTPSGGSAVDYTGLDWGGVTTPWGSGSVALTDAGNSAVGTGVYEYKRSAYPRPGHFMPAAVPKGTEASSNLTKSDANQSEFDHLNDNGGPPSEADYLYATAQNKYWYGGMNAPAVGGNTDALTVSGNVTVERVETYAWARMSGSGDTMDGDLIHFNQTSGGSANPTITHNTTSDTLGTTYSLSVREHTQASGGPSPGTADVDWDVAKVNGASFGVRVK